MGKRFTLLAITLILLAVAIEFGIARSQVVVPDPERWVVKAAVANAKTGELTGSPLKIDVDGAPFNSMEECSHFLSSLGPKVDSDGFFLLLWCEKEPGMST